MCIYVYMKQHLPRLLFYVLSLVIILFEVMIK